MIGEALVFPLDGAVAQAVPPDVAAVVGDENRAIGDDRGALQVITALAVQIESPPKRLFDERRKAPLHQRRSRVEAVAREPDIVPAKQRNDGIAAYGDLSGAKRLPGVEEQRYSCELQLASVLLERLFD